VREGTATRSGLIVELGGKSSRPLPGIEAAMINNLSNALIESTNTKLRVLHRMAFGFKEPEHLIALALLDRVVTARHFQGGAEDQARPPAARSASLAPTARRDPDGRGCPTASGTR